MDSIIKIILGLTLFSLFGFVVNYIFYYLFYGLKIFYAGLYIIFKVLGASSFGLTALYYFMIYVLVGLVLLFILKLFR